MINFQYFCCFEQTEKIIEEEPELKKKEKIDN